MQSVVSRTGNRHSSSGAGELSFVCNRPATARNDAATRKSHSYSYYPFPLLIPYYYLSFTVTYPFLHGATVPLASTFP